MVFPFTSITHKQEKEGQSKGGKSFQRGKSRGTTMPDARSEDPAIEGQGAVPTKYAKPDREDETGEEKSA